MGNTGVLPNYGQIHAPDTFTGDGATVAFVLTNSIASVQSIGWVEGGIPQLPGTDFTLGGDGVTITRTTAPANGVAIFVTYLGTSLTIGTPSDGTVAKAKLTTTLLNEHADTVITASDEILFGDATDSNANKKDTVQGILDLVPAPTFSGCAVRLSANESIANASFVIVDWDTAIYETGGEFWDSGTNPSRLTVPTGVTKVILSGSIVWATNSTANRRIQLFKNASYAFDGSIYVENTATGSASETGQVFVTPPLTVSATDYFEVNVFQNSGGTLAIDNANYGYFIWFAMEVIQ